MRILFLSTWFPYPPDNGSKLRVHYLLNALQQAHEVDLAAFQFPPAASADGRMPDLYRRATIVRYNPFEPGTVRNRLRFLSAAPVVTHPVPAMETAVRQLLARTRYDAVISSTTIMSRYALLAPKGTVRVLEEHNSMVRWMWERYRQQASGVQRLRCWASWQKARRYEAWLYRQFDLCLLVSEEDRRATLQMLPAYCGPVEVVPNGVDCQRNRPGTVEPVANRLVYNGSLTYTANYDAMHHFLTAVWPILRHHVPDIALTITGSTAGVDLAALPSDGHVTFTGYVDDIRPIVGGAAVCIAPIRQGGGTRLKILEAMALGTPVVATAKAADGLQVTDGEDILLADAPSDFASQVKRVLRDPALRARLAARARDFVEQRYDWKPIGRRFVDLVTSAGQRAASGSRAQ
jgi:glycosyltransferase involved in cell wall biosynthesis